MRIEAIKKKFVTLYFGMGIPRNAKLVATLQNEIDSSFWLGIDDYLKETMKMWVEFQKDSMKLVQHFAY